MRINKLRVTGCSPSVWSGESVYVPVLNDLLSDHFDVFKALHTADVVHQDVGVGIADTSAAQIQPLLKGRQREENIYVTSSPQSQEAIIDAGMLNL